MASGGKGSGGKLPLQCQWSQPRVPLCQHSVCTSPPLAPAQLSSMVRDHDIRLLAISPHVGKAARQVLEDQGIQVRARVGVCACALAWRSMAGGSREVQRQGSSGAPGHPGEGGDRRVRAVALRIVHTYTGVGGSRGAKGDVAWAGEVPPPLRPVLPSR
mgnify:CR=1 FL=1